jgi:hypothetical protein
MGALIKVKIVITSVQLILIGVLIKVKIAITKLVINYVVNDTGNHVLTQKIQQCKK